MNTSPVLQALVNARVAETIRSWQCSDADMWAAAVERLGSYPGEIDGEALVPFAEWCAAHDVRPCPAQPASVAKFVLDRGALGIERLSEILSAVAAAHQAQGFANPVATYLVGSALLKVGPLEAPRSWPKDYRPRFAELPADLRDYIIKREAERDREVRRAQSEAALAKQKLEKARETEAVD